MQKDAFASSALGSALCVTAYCFLLLIGVICVICGCSRGVTRSLRAKATTLKKPNQLALVIYHRERAYSVLFHQFSRVFEAGGWIDKKSWSHWPHNISSHSCTPPFA